MPLFPATEKALKATAGLLRLGGSIDFDEAAKYQKQLETGSAKLREAFHRTRNRNALVKLFELSQQCSTAISALESLAWKSMFAKAAAMNGERRLQAFEQTMSGASVVRPTESMGCLHCGDDDRPYAYKGCGHRAYCEDCKDDEDVDQSVCSFCRKESDGLMKTYD